MAGTENKLQHYMLKEALINYCVQIDKKIFRQIYLQNVGRIVFCQGFAKEFDGK